MKNFVKLSLLGFVAMFLSACAVVSIQSQMMPDVNLTKKDALFFVEQGDGSISHQKYNATLRQVLVEQGFNLVHTKSHAKYLLNVVSADFQADLYQNLPVSERTVLSGNVGGMPVYGQSVTTRTETVHRKIPTHNSKIRVTDRNTGRIVWEVEMHKSYDLYNHPELKSMLARMMSLYGTEQEISQMVSDKPRW